MAVSTRLQFAWMHAFGAIKTNGWWIIVILFE